jgi:hypothetical protein
MRRLHANIYEKKLKIEVFANSIIFLLQIENYHDVRK